MDSTNRISKYKEFKAFSNTSKLNFEKISQSDKKIETLNSYYNLCICPGGSQSGMNDRLIEIFYGHRPFDTQRTNPFDRNSIKVLVENGARLHYNLLDNGQVVAILYPATTDNLTPIEDAIVISCNLSPHQLIKLYKAHFALFNAYMRCTSLDGMPSLIDKIKVFQLRFSKSYIVDGKKQQTKILSGFVGTLKFAMSVGLSGFLLAAILAATSNPIASYTNDIKQINQTTKTISEQIENLSGRLAKLHSPR